MKLYPKVLCCLLFVTTCYSYCISDSKLISFYSFIDSSDIEEDLSGNGYRIFNMQGFSNSEYQIVGYLGNFSLPFNPNPNTISQLGFGIWINTFSQTDFYIFDVPYSDNQG